MNAIKSHTESGAKAEAVALSIANSGAYITIGNCFGLFAFKHKRLHVFAPSDCAFDWYALNGVVKKFTQSQKIADQNATPTMA